MKLRNLLYLICFLFSLNVKALGLNDLSILIPLPESLELPRMLSPYDLGKQGTLLSKIHYNKLFKLVVNHSNETLWKEQLKVVAIRIDPCFIEGTGPVPCRRQVRLIWQPIIEKENSLTTRDASLHSFYEFSDSEFSQVLNQWKSWSKTNKKLPLGIHPILAKEGLSGAHWNQLRSLILNFCGEKNLVRITAMGLSGSDQLWIFSGLDINPTTEKSKEIMIPRIQSTIQTITQSSFDPNHFWGALTPAPNADHEFNLLVEDSMFFQKHNTEVEVRKVARSYLSFENPKKHNTGTLDCASCHLTSMTHQWVQVNYPNLKWDIEFSDVKYQNTLNLENTTLNKVNPHQFRIFGYFEKQPAISQRVINETAEVFDFLKL